MTLRKVLPLLLLFASAVCAADLSGTWKGILHTREGGEFEVTMVLKADGSQLTGSMTQGTGAARDIEDGKVTDDQVSFSVTYKSPTAVRKAMYSGKLEGSQLKLTSQIEGQTRKQEITFERK